MSALSWVQSPRLGDGNLNCPMLVVSNTDALLRVKLRLPEIE